MVEQNKSREKKPQKKDNPPLSSDEKLTKEEEEQAKELESLQLSIEKTAQELLMQENSRNKKPSDEEMKSESKTDTKDQQALKIAEEKMKNNNSDKAQSTEQLNRSLRGLKTRIRLLSLLVILAAAGAGYAGYYHQLHKNDDINALLEQVLSSKAHVLEIEQNIKNDLLELKKKDQFINDLLKSNEQMSAQNQELKSAVSDLSSKTDQASAAIEQVNIRLNNYESRNPNDWLLAQSYFLVSNAQSILSYTENLKAALLHLHNADLMLVKIDEPEVVALRQAIISDIQQIKALQEIDRNGLVFKIDSILDSTDSMHLNDALSTNLKKDSFKKDEEVSSNLDDWKSNLWTSVKTFSTRFIEIRRKDDAIVNQFLSPEQTKILLKNIKTELLLAKVAVFQADQESFSHNIAEVITHIRNYYDLKDPVVSANLASLEELSQCSVVLKKPDTLKSYGMFKSFATDRFNLYKTIETENESAEQVQETEASDNSKKDVKDEGKSSKDSKKAPAAKGKK